MITCFFQRVFLSVIYLSLKCEKQQQETIAELRDQLRDQEHRHSRELEMLSEAYSKVFNKLAKKHAMQVQSLEYKVRSVRKLITERSSEEVE